MAGLLFFPTPLPLGVPFMTAGALVLAKESSWVQRRLAAVFTRYPKVSQRLLAQTRTSGPRFVRGLVDDFLSTEVRTVSVATHAPDPDGDPSGAGLPVGALPRGRSAPSGQRHTRV